MEEMGIDKLHQYYLLKIYYENLVVFYFYKCSYVMNECGRKKEALT